MLYATACNYTARNAYCDDKLLASAFADARQKADKRIHNKEVRPKFYYDVIWSFLKVHLDEGKLDFKRGGGTATTVAQLVTPRSTPPPQPKPNHNKGKRPRDGGARNVVSSKPQTSPLRQTSRVPAAGCWVRGGRCYGAGGRFVEGLPLSREHLRGLLGRGKWLGWSLDWTVVGISMRRGQSNREGWVVKKREGP